MNSYQKGTHFWDFLIPDADFELRVQNIGKEIIPAKTSPSIFDNLTLDPNFFDAKLAETREKVQGIISQNEESQEKNQSNYDSEFAKKFPYYSEKFQKILELKKSPTLNDLLKRYAKILLYILEQFQIKWDKKHHIRFMLVLKKVLQEITTFEEAEVYTAEMLNKTSYIRTSWEIQEEIELLYSIYYENYVVLQKEVHMDDKKRREDILETIEVLEHDMLWKNYRDTEYWWSQQTNLEDAITQKRQELIQKRRERRG